MKGAAGGGVGQGEEPQAFLRAQAQLFLSAGSAVSMPQAKSVNSLPSSRISGLSPRFQRLAACASFTGELAPALAPNRVPSKGLRSLGRDSSMKVLIPYSGADNGTAGRQRARADRTADVPKAGAECACHRHDPATIMRAPWRTAAKGVRIGWRPPAGGRPLAAIGGAPTTTPRRQLGK